MKLSFTTKKILTRYYKQFLLLFGLFSLVPYFIVSFFNNPSYIDDYCFSTRAIILGFWEAQKNQYFNINGRYTSTLVLSLDIVNPNNSNYFKLFPVILILLSITALYLLIDQLFHNKGVFYKISIALATFLLYICSMPILSEGFYWWSSAITYQLGNIFLLFFITIIINKKNTICKTILGLIVLFFSIGSNECNIIAINLFLIFFIVYKYHNEKKINLHLVLTKILSLIFSAFTILAPGNYIRMEKNDNTKDFVFSFLLSLGQLGWSLLTWSGIIILFSIVIYPFLLSDVDKNNNSFKINYKGLFLGNCIIAFSIFFIGFWAQGEPIPPRARNSVYLFFILGFTYTVLNYLNNSKFFKNFSFSKNKNLSFTLVICLISIVFSKENFVETVKDVVKFKAYKFDKEMKERVSILANNKVEEPYFEPIKNQPYSIFFNEFEYNDTDHKGCIYNYFKKQSNLKLNKK